FDSRAARLRDKRLFVRGTTLLLSFSSWRETLQSAPPAAQPHPGCARREKGNSEASAALLLKLAPVPAIHQRVRMPWPFRAFVYEARKPERSRADQELERACELSTRYQARRDRGHLRSGWIRYCERLHFRGNDFIPEVTPLFFPDNRWRLQQLVTPPLPTSPGFSAGRRPFP